MNVPEIETMEYSGPAFRLNENVTIIKKRNKISNETKIISGFLLKMSALEMSMENNINTYPLKFGFFERMNDANSDAPSHTKTKTNILKNTPPQRINPTASGIPITETNTLFDNSFNFFFQFLIIDNVK